MDKKQQTWQSKKLNNLYKIIKFDIFYANMKQSRMKEKVYKDYLLMEKIN